MRRSELSSFGDWELVKVLGSGGFGEVLHWRNRRSNEEIATKRLKQNVRFSEDEESKLKQRWLQEYEWMRDLKTPYIVRGLNLDDKKFIAYLNENHKWCQLPAIVMEYCNGGDLRRHLQKIENLNGLHEFQIREVLNALRHAIEYLHNECHIEHRDLKPDNIVIHQTAGRMIYKLTDFGFARKISENTILKSVVGTRHYFAPEVVDTAKYTKTVDYWSLGVIAFEIICGILPFIPHQEMYQIIVNIKKKEPQCIAITENLDIAKKFEFHSEIFPENQVTDVFKKKMESWLTLALDANYKSRGSGSAESKNGSIPFYSVLDNILNSKILTVFCLNIYKFFSFEITSEMKMLDLITQMEDQMGIAREKLFLIFPSGHPRPHLTPVTQPLDFFVEEWRDTTDPNNPPVMLYALGCQVDYNFGDPNVSTVIKKCLSLKKGNSFPNWQLQQLIRSTHFLLSSENCHKNAYLNGIKEYALTIEDSIFHWNCIQILKSQVLLIMGNVQQFLTTIQTAEKIILYKERCEQSDKLMAGWTAKANDYANDIHKINTEITERLDRRYNSVLRRAKEQATEKLFEELLSRDIYELKNFRGLLEQRTELTDDKLISLCQESVYKCIAKRNELLSNKLIERSRNILNDIQIEFSKIKAIVDDTYQHLVNFRAKLEEDTKSFLQSIWQKHDKSSYKSNEPSEIIKPKFDESTEVSTQELLEEVMQNLQRMETELTIDEVPATINFL